MAMRQKGLEFKVRIGLFVFTGLALLTIITFSIGDFLFKPGYMIEATLDFANGVQKAAPVRLAGVEVGEVKDASVFKDEEGKTRVRLLLWLSDDAKVEDDAKICINTLGLIGEKYVEVIPGTPGRPLLRAGDKVKGMSAVSVEQMTRKGYEIALKVEKVVDSLDYILSQVKSGQGTIGKLLLEEGLYNDIEEMVKDLKRHPWKLLNKPRKVRKKTEDKSRGGTRGNFSS